MRKRERLVAGFHVGVSRGEWGGFFAGGGWSERDADKKEGEETVREIGVERWEGNGEGDVDREREMNFNLFVLCFFFF